TTVQTTATDTHSPSTTAGDTTTSVLTSTSAGTSATSAADTTAPATTPSDTTTPPTTTVICLNGGQWNGKVCECSTGFTGDQCQYAHRFCKNGGFWDGIKCQCTTLYYGTECELLVESIEIEPPPAIVTAQVEITVTVTSENFSEDLNNRSSQAFQKFKEIFTKQMEILYSGITEYEGVNIIRITPGSVVVEHEVLLRTKFIPEYEKVLKNASQEVKEKIMTITNEQIMVNNNCSDLLCFKENTTEVKSTEITQYDPEAECQEKAKEAGDYAQYFFVEYKDEKPNCVTACMQGFNSSMDCNYGKCQLERSGPRCFCLTTDTHWYRGENCELSTQKSLVYGLVGAAGAVVLVVFIALLVFTLHSKREVKRQKYKLSQLYKWYEEDGGQAPGTFQNIGFDIHEEREGSINLDPIYSNFQPSLSHIDPETKIQTQRPQVVMTSF
uniref:SEA domain-containing protein n=1 Tax=Loxodonta africana TaxID=9785 RepID=G3TQW0_LOXAF